MRPADADAGNVFTCVPSVLRGNWHRLCQRAVRRCQTSRDGTDEFSSVLHVLWTLLRDDVFHHLTGNACQPCIEALPLHGKTFVIDTEQVEHGRVEVGNCDGVLLGGVPELVCRAVADPGL